MSRSAWLKTVAMAICLSTLVLLPVWRKIVGGNFYLMDKPPAAVHYVVALLNLTLLAIVFLRLLVAGRYFCITVLAGSRVAIKVIKFLRFCLLLFFPFSLGIFSQLAWRSIVMADMRPVLQEAQSRQPKLREGQAQRAVWMIYDELDYRQVFEARPSDLDLPEFDKLSSQSLSVSNAFPPAANTMLSIPSLISGKSVCAAQSPSSSSLLVRFCDADEMVPWASYPNILSRTHDAGFQVAMVGWYHPYCRLFGEKLTSCAWYPFELNLDDAFPDMSLSQSMYVQMEIVLKSWKLRDWVPLLLKQTGLSKAVSARREAIKARRYLATYRHIAEDAKRYLADPAYDLVVVHWPIPHPPAIYNRFRNTGSSERQPGYLDNLALVDTNLGETRRVLEEAGLWNTTTLVVSADHSWRVNMYRSTLAWTTEEEAVSEAGWDRRVPMLVKLPGQDTPVTYSHEFKTIWTSDLLITILNAEISNEQSLVTWLDEHVAQSN